MARTDFLHRPATEWSRQQAAETIRTWQQLLPWGLATIKASGTLLLEQGSFPQEVFLLERGLVKLSCALPDSRQALLALRVPGQLVGGVFVHWLGEYYPVSAITAIECRLSCLSGDVMQRELHRNPEVAPFLLRQQGFDLYNQAVALVEAKTLDTTELFAQLVRQLAAVLDLPRTPRPLRLPLPLSDAEIASLLGVTKVYFSRLKKRWEEKGCFHWEGHTLVIP
jgi:CRP-like cAMP-binding protein